ncbi:RNA-directed DNA polymerase [Nocardioides sp. zg-579]|uniref:RNA-directed DNA polymerase n=1 Tax=Nocardioides marmotae TaxID=2663857 RepID=A0A6I3JCD7_9ACTN|nr:RNA-directed DNA polymerase [Gordonia jinghuaiqii]MTB95787.1 RNA-directed DNA polymerase [Nocardioides marmotae]
MLGFWVRRTVRVADHGSAPRGRAGLYRAERAAAFSRDGEPVHDTGLPPRGYPGGHRHVRAQHRARLAALRCRSSRARRDWSSSAAAPSPDHRVAARVRADLARALAAGFLAGEWTRPGLVESGSVVLGRRPRWLAPLARQTIDLYPRPPHDRPRELAASISARPAAAKAAGVRPLVQPVSPTRMMTNRWRLPVLDGLGDLADLLGLTSSELDWFADPRHLARTAADGRLQHYLVSHRVAASGGIRVLEAPKRRLKGIQRVLLDEVASLIPPHDAARGFRPGGSVRSYAAPHAGRPVVVRLDLEAFFASVTVSRIYGLWRSAGYPEPVAHCLAGLTTTVLPHAAWRAVPRPADDDLLDAHWRLGRRLAAPHLPQGAPTSPAMANLAAFGLDVRLTALAESWGGRYTRYADDLAFSGARSWGTGTSRLLEVIEEIVRDEGFRLNTRKTGVMPRAGRQALGGLVVNEQPRVARREVDLLRAILHNCRRHGPSTQNRDGVPAYEQHLRGRIAWVAQHDPVRGARLLTEHEAIDWTR